MARKNDRLLTECGCLVIPDAMEIMGRCEAECPVHGWSSIVRAARPREVYNMILGLPLDHESVYPDIPPF